MKWKTIYKYQFDEAKAQWVIDKLLYDKPWELWELWGVRRDDYDSQFRPMIPTPKFIIRNNIYKRTEPENGMETIYKYPFDEAKAQWVIDKLLYDKPWELWGVRRGEYNTGDYNTPFRRMSRTPKFITQSNICKRTEPKDRNDL